jgi:ppGpp synthetase/RelA/SpoT-type nucleotidyltranferase
MNHGEYIRDGRPRYELFARTVVRILQAAIDAGPQAFRLQQITHRAKDPVSLKRKLTERGLLDSNSIEEELKDLAGCRLIFYTNTDVDRFLNSRLIFENFVVDFDGSKIHHAVGTERSADELYFAIHYLVSLTPARLALPEYARFQGMRCEVQLQTILNHAWAETSHDVVYHPAPMQGFGTKQFADIKKRTANIMNKYLLPAGYEFQKVQHDYERLLAGKELFDRRTLETLDTAKDNNERYEQLHRIREDLLPFYDDIRAVAPEVIGRAADAIKKARDTATTPIETTFGTLRGHTADYVTNEGLQLIDDLRYVDVELTFRVLCDLYVTARSDEERNRILQSVERLAHYDLNAWRQVGFGVQKVLYDAICTLSEAEKAALRPLITEMCRLFLETDLRGTTWHFDSVSLQRGAVPPSTAFGEFRKSILKLLFDLYQGAASPAEKMPVIQALNTATRFPMEGGRDHLIELVLDDTRQIVEFFTERLANEPFEIVQHLEHHFLWVYRRSREMVEGRTQDAIAAKAQAVVAAVEAFRDRANANDQFVKFKTLVGFESVFPMEWSGQSMEIERPRKYRADKIAEYVASVTADNADEWYGIIQLCTAVKSNDWATFPSLGEFLKQLAARSPKIVVGYLKRDEGLLRDFLPAVLAGFAESSKPDIARSLISDWIEQGAILLRSRITFASPRTPAQILCRGSANRR